MTMSRALSIAAATAAGLLALAFAMTRYTLPNHGSPAYGEIERLLEDALGTRPAAIPEAPAAMRLEPVPAPPMEFRDRVPAPPPIEPGAAAWLARGVANDAGAVRGWLGAAVLATSTTSGDTVHTVLWRLTLHRGCPFVSRLHATATGRATGELRFVALDADCPRATRP